jgi:hypothetical protein
MQYSQNKLYQLILCLSYGEHTHALYISDGYVIYEHLIGHPLLLCVFSGTEPILTGGSHGKRIAAALKET